MAWNQPGEDKKRPPPRGNPDDSSLDDMLRRWQRRVQRLWRPGSGRGTAALVLAGVVIVVWLGCGICQIDPNDRGVVQRFGRFVAVEQPGLSWHWPWPIETIKKVNVTSSVNGSDYKALVLTADQSLVDISWSVQYRIADPKLYLFELHDQSATLREASETVFRELVARYDLPALLSGDARAPRLAGEAQLRIQQALDIYQAGIIVMSVTLTELQLPDAVLAAQRDAVKADEDRRRLTEEAQAYANDILPKAEASAQQQIADAQVYAKQTVATAEGEAARFSEVAAVYAQAPEVTRNRIYTETMESILSHSRKIILDTKSGGSMIYLPLDKLAEAVKAANAAASPAAAANSNPAPATPAAGSSNAGADRADSDERSRERTDR